MFCFKFATKTFQLPIPASPPFKLFIIYAREDQPALLELKAYLNYESN
jgi:hypothetical protein